MPHIWPAKVERSCRQLQAETVVESSLEYLFRLQFSIAYSCPGSQEANLYCPPQPSLFLLTVDKAFAPIFRLLRPEVCWPCSTLSHVFEDRDLQNLRVYKSVSSRDHDHEVDHLPSPCRVSAVPACFTAATRSSDFTLPIISVTSHHVGNLRVHKHISRFHQSLSLLLKLPDRSSRVASSNQGTLAKIVGSSNFIICIDSYTRAESDNGLYFSAIVSLFPNQSLLCLHYELLELLNGHTHDLCNLDLFPYQ